MVSIVIPVYNAEKTIERCIESIVHKNISFLYEIVLVNDGSKDNSKEILSAIASKYKNVKLIEQVNKGVSGARNTGISNAEGEWIMFMDADDFFHMEWFKIIEKYLNSYNKMIVFSNDNYEEIDKENIVNMITGIQPKYNLSCIWSKMYRLDIIKKNNIRFQEGIINGEDALFNLEYYLNCKNIEFVKEIIYNYSPNDMSATNKFNSKFIESDMLYQRKLKQILDDMEGDYDSVCKVSTLNAWLVFFERYSHAKQFSLNDFKLLLNNTDYMNVIENYKNYKQYFSKVKIMLLMLLHYKKYRVIYLLLKIKNVVKKLHKGGRFF